MSRRHRASTVVLGWRDERLAGFVARIARWADGGYGRASRRRRAGVDRCRRWAQEGAHRPGEMAPPSWFFIAMPFGMAWYQVLDGVWQGWYWLARRICEVLGRVLSGLLTAAAAVLRGGRRDSGPAGPAA